MEQELNYTNIFLFIIIILLVIVGSIGLAIKDMKHSDEDYLIENKCEKDFEEYSDYMDINLSNEQISCYCSPSCTLSGTIVKIKEEKQMTEEEMEGYIESCERQGLDWEEEMRFEEKEKTLRRE